MEERILFPVLESVDRATPHSVTSRLFQPNNRSHHALLHRRLLFPYHLQNRVHLSLLGSLPRHLWHRPRIQLRTFFPSLRFRHLLCFHGRQSSQILRPGLVSSVDGSSLAKIDSTVLL